MLGGPFDFTRQRSGMVRHVTDGVPDVGGPLLYPVCCHTRELPGLLLDGLSYPRGITLSSVAMSEARSATPPARWAACCFSRSLACET